MNSEKMFPVSKSTLQILCRLCPNEITTGEVKEILAAAEQLKARRKKQ